MVLQPLPVLVADDETLSRRILVRHLTSLGHRVLEAADGREALDMYRGHEPPLIITDWMMPAMSGPEFVAQVRAIQGEIYPYIILLTAKDDADSLLQGLSSGADDFVVKPISRQELEVRVAVGSRIVDLQQKLVAANRRLKQLAGIDHLSGLLNRRALEEALEQRARQPHLNAGMAYLMLDLDHFKAVNDTYGHDAGDEVIKAVSAVLAAMFREYDVVSRMGGEEFLVVLSRVSPPQAMAVAERIRATIAGMPVPLENGQSISVTVSLGVFCSGERTDIDGAAAIRLADQALYQSKADGRNRVTLHTPQQP